MGLWNHIPVRNLIAMQQMAALKELERKIAKDHADGYGKDVDEHLERYFRLLNALKEPQA